MATKLHSTKLWRRSICNIASIAAVTVIFLAKATNATPTLAQLNNAPTKSLGSKTAPALDLAPGDRSPGVNPASLTR